MKPWLNGSPAEEVAKPPARGLFITGTDTEVGKTVVAAALALAFTARGLKVGIMKPVESGCNRLNGTLVPQDAVFLCKAAACEAPLDLVNPYALEHPLAPTLAAELEGIPVSLSRIEASYRKLASMYDVMLVEGAGGILTPAFGELRMLDLAGALGLPVLVVARNALGAINHTSLTVRAAQAAGRPVYGVVLNNVSSAQDVAVQSNGDALRRWAGAPFLGEMPYMTALDHDLLRRAAEAHLDVVALLTALLAMPQISKSGGQG